MIKKTGVAATALILAAVTPATAQAQEPAEQVVNGTFDSGTAPWWWTGNAPASVVDGRLCAQIPAGTVNPWDAIVGQNDIDLVAGESYTFSFTASATTPVTVRANVQLADPPYTQQFSAAPALTPEPQAFTYTFTSDTGTALGQVAFQVGGAATAWTFCLDDVSLRGGAEPPVYVPDTGPRVRVNQVGYLTNGPKNATVVTTATEPLPWQLRDASGATVASGTSTPRGVDASSGQNVHSVDFSAVTATGAGFTLSADGETSYPFDLGTDAYQRLQVDALSFYYTQRSGIEILDSIAPGYGRPAGHVGVAPNQGDTSVPCLPGTCDYSLDVSGGWYDAGDHGKYVVNGGISVYQLMSAFERTKLALARSPELRIPERGNAVPDTLDEARWELEFLLRMQVPAGQPLAGMAHHKIHDENWTGLPLLPSNDPQPRYLHPPSTAATLNLAATAAQGARLFANYDPAFARRMLAAARTAWDAAQANPAMFAPAEGVGGGPYNDDVVADEFYWAAAELYLTTGAKRYADFVMASPEHTRDVFRPEAFDWAYTAPIARLELATVPNALPDRERVRQSVVDGARRYLATIEAHPYGVPYAPASGRWEWGSNNLILNNMVVLGTAYDITGDRAFRDGVIEGMDYILGRNALNQSYVTGYGEKASHNQHSRWYANQLNPALPNPPPGSLAGGPNSSLQDPVAQRLLRGCAPQFCYVDDIESWSTNELTINWNSTLAWVSGFLADQGPAAAPPPAPACSVRYLRLASWPGGFITVVVVTNTGREPLRGWTLGWSFIGAQRVQLGWGASFAQNGSAVEATSTATLRPGHSAWLGFIGGHAWGANWTPEHFTVNGASCGT